MSGWLHSSRPSCSRISRFEDHAQILLEEGTSVFSSIYGIPSKQILDEFRRPGIVLIGTVTTVGEADRGIDQRLNSEALIERVAIRKVIREIKKTSQILRPLFRSDIVSPPMSKLQRKEN
jgi:hypothetical protein